MHQRALLRILLLPSFLSGTLVGVAAVGILGYHVWEYVSNNQLFYSHLFGAYGIKTYLWQSSFDLVAWSRAFLGSSVAYYLLVSGAAIAAGLLVFTILQGVTLLSRGTSHLLHETAIPVESRKVIYTELLRQLGLRILGLVGWGAYAAFFASILYPFVVTLNQVGLERRGHAPLAGWSICLAALLFLAVALHMHVIFARLCMLRPRLFGGARALEAADVHTLQ